MTVFVMRKCVSLKSSLFVVSYEQQVYEVECKKYKCTGGRVHLLEIIAWELANKIK